jgi:hypothetical protein
MKLSLLAMFGIAGVVMDTSACSSASSSSGAGSSIPDAAIESQAADGARAETGSEVEPSSDGASGGDDSGPGVDASNPCQTYANKAYQCCQGSSDCNGVTEQTFLEYCQTFYAACQVYYSCYLSASNCTDATQCPTLGDGGCS